MSPPTMMVPRSYSFTSEKEKRSRPSSPKSRTGSDAWSTAKRGDRKTDTKLNASSNATDKSSARKDVVKPKRLTSIAHSTPSQPVVIPTRTASPKKSRHNNPRPVDTHDSTALSPSMAALLAITSVPRARAQAIKSGTRDRITSAEFRQSVSSTSPHSWSVLQSPPDEFKPTINSDLEIDFEVGSIASHASTIDLERATMYRSLSSDSIPSLDIEHDVFNSPDSPPMPRTPSSRRAKSPRREKVKTLATSQPLAVDELHPLSSVELKEKEDPDQQNANSLLSSSTAASHPPKLSPSLASTRPSHFRSNLTASLHRLKNVARSVLPTPSVSTVLAINSRTLPRRDSPPRPRSPLPMNNSAFSPKTLLNLKREDNTAQPLASDLYFSSTPSEEYRAIASSIQMQPYMRRGSDDDLDKATAPPVFLSSTPAPPILLPGVDSPRPREPRENSDFLRVVVLEMNMRRAGKLGDVGGRARIWIGPRVEKPGQEPTNGGPPAKTTRAERGMGTKVASELAEAMMVDGDEANVAKSFQSDDDTQAFDADLQPKPLSRQVQLAPKANVPSRWQAVVA